MKIDIWVLTTVYADELTPALPQVFGSEAAAEAGFDAALRGEWAACAPCDDEGHPLPYPRSSTDAHEKLRNEYSDGSWATWKGTRHTLDVPLPADIEQALAVLTGCAEKEIEDIEAGIEDGIYDDYEGENTAHIAALNGALQIMATEGTAILAVENAPLEKSGAVLPAVRVDDLNIMLHGTLPSVEAPAMRQAPCPGVDLADEAQKDGK